ncbi:hypothetical protein BD414DRAFT_563594 [Trametes punicea]|nr:hypothetical protein BD414DRAFT_563594 [Trametes punicea]
MKLYREDPRSAEHQLIAVAITASVHNNRIREPSGLPEVMPGIAIVYNSPIFYKIPVRVELVLDVEKDMYAPQATILVAHVPAVARPQGRYSEGMKPLDNKGNSAVLRGVQGCGGHILPSRV